MKPTVKLASTRTPDGGEMVLLQHDRDFLIRVNGTELMHSRRHESELELARKGCRHLRKAEAPVVLVGGLGLGYSLRQTLDLLRAEARVIVAELSKAVVEWNREFTGELNGRPLDDPRVEIRTGDVLAAISKETATYDAILLDVDNGPTAMTHAANRNLYGFRGIHACRAALKRKGCLAVWSVDASKEFEQRLMSADFQVRRYRVPAWKGNRAPSRFIWVACEDASVLPPGGGEPR